MPSMCRAEPVPADVLQPAEADGFSEGAAPLPRIYFAFAMLDNTASC